jgi:hypothetical protein
MRCFDTALTIWAIFAGDEAFFDIHGLDGNFYTGSDPATQVRPMLLLPLLAYLGCPAMHIPASGHVMLSVLADVELTGCTGEWR